MKDYEITKEQKLILLKQILDDVSFKALKDKDIQEAFSFNLANIIISTRGEF